MIIKIIIGIIVLMGLFLYIIVHGSARKIDEEMQEMLDEEQSMIVAELSKKSSREANEKRIIPSENVYVDNSRGVEILKDAEGKVVRAYEGIDMSAVYTSKSMIFKFFKRFFDIILSGLGLIVLSPVFLFTAIAIKMEDGGPVIFSGKRWGKDFEYFPMHKFRSMCVNAEKMTAQVVKEDNKNGMAFKIVDDPRMTKIGKFMRKTSIDELPQLFNVFKGQMSLVGPRPIQTTTTEGDPYDMQRWCVKPGITCYWQVCGRAEVPWDEWVEMDLKYIDEMSLWTDLKLLIKTVTAVLHKGGAV